MSRNLQIILIIVGALVGVGLLVWAVVAFLPGGEEPTPDTNTNTVTTTTNTNTTGGLPTTPVETNTNTTIDVDDDGQPLPEQSEVDDQASVLRLARIVAERYGTFSNRNNFENITNLEPFMTQKLQAESARFIDDNQNGGIAEEPYGITTTVASMELTNYEEGGTATAELQTRRVETKGDEEPRVFTQNVELRFEREDDSWKVDAITWK